MNRTTDVIPGHSESAEHLVPNLPVPDAVGIPGFTITGELGRGGMSIVYLAVQEVLDRQVALKVMSPELSADPSFKERFINEGKIVARLTHPHIVTLYAIDFVGNQPYIAMEYVQGGNLAEYIQQGLELSQSLLIVKKIAQALGFAHRKGFVHRDIKPMNILFRDENTPVLTDFGIAKAVSSNIEITKTGITVGTPAYMSPEQARGLKVDGRSDLYSLGIVFYEMLVGQRPFEAEDSLATAMKHLTEPVPKLPPRLNFLQPLLDRILAKEPNERFRDSQAFIQAIDAAVPSALLPAVTDSDDATVVALPAVDQPPPQAQDKPGGQSRLRWLAGGAGVLVLSAAAWFGVQELVDRDEQLRPLLEQARAQMDAAQLIAPTDDNALATYRRILADDPDQPQALAGIDAIAKRLAADIVAARDKGQTERSRRLLEQALAVLPEQNALRQLRGDPTPQQRRLTELLERAAQQQAAERLLEPANGNAYATYQEVLALDPANPEAQAGLERIAEQYAARVRQTAAEDGLPEALALLESGLTAFPQNAALRTLQTEFTAQQKAAQQTQRINDLLAKAQARLQTQRYTRPDGDSARDLFRQVQALDPDNPTAQTGLRQIARHFEQQARAFYRAGEFGPSLEQIEQGLTARPDDTPLLELQATVREKQRTQEIQASLLDKLSPDQKQNIGELLRQAERQLWSNRLTQPAGNNAYESYQAVLELEPNNLRALAGLRRIGDGYANLAQRQLDRGDISRGLEFIREGLAIVPDHAELQRLLQQHQPARRIGAVIDINREWGFVVLELDKPGTIQAEQAVFLQDDSRQRRNLTVKRIDSTQASAIPEDGLAGLAVGMPIFVD